MCARARACARPRGIYCDVLCIANQKPTNEHHHNNVCAGTLLASIGHQFCANRIRDLSHANHHVRYDSADQKRAIIERNSRRGGCQLIGQ